MLIGRNVPNVHSAIIDFFAHEMVGDVNVLGASMELSVLCEGDCALIVTENHSGFRVRIVGPKELIKKILQPDSFLGSLCLTDILCLISGQSYGGLALRGLANSVTA